MTVTGRSTHYNSNTITLDTSDDFPFSSHKSFRAFRYSIQQDSAGNTSIHYAYWMVNLVLGKDEKQAFSPQDQTLAALSFRDVFRNRFIAFFGQSRNRAYNQAARRKANSSLTSVMWQGIKVWKIYPNSSHRRILPHFPIATALNFGSEFLSRLL